MENNITKKINKLPKDIRDFIHELESFADPAGIIRENIFLKDLIKVLEQEKVWKDIVVSEASKILVKQFPNDSDLLCILGSYGDTLPDDEIYQALYSWRTTGSSFKSISCQLDDRD